MSDQEKRIAIAEECLSYRDYLHSIDAMQKAVLAQDNDFQCRFAELITMRSPHHACEDETEGYIVLFHQLTASDWADAFIEVLEGRKK